MWNISPNVCHLQIITEYLDLLNIKIQSIHLNHIPVGPLLLSQEVPLGLNGYGTRQHQYKHIWKRAKNVKQETKLAITLVLLPSNPLSTCTRSDQGHIFSSILIIWVIQHFSTQRFWWVLITTLYQLMLNHHIKKWSLVNTLWHYMLPKQQYDALKTPLILHSFTRFYFKDSAVKLFF